MRKNRLIRNYLLIFVMVGGATSALLFYFVNVQDWLINVFISINMASFVMFGYDKSVANSPNVTRLPERFFYLISLIGGAVGIVCGAFFFRHKTRKLKFLIWPMLILLIQIGVVYFWLTGKV